MLTIVYLCIGVGDCGHDFGPIAAPSASQAPIWPSKKSMKQLKIAILIVYSHQIRYLSPSIKWLLSASEGFVQSESSCFCLPMPYGSWNCLSSNHIFLALAPFHNRQCSIALKPCKVTKPNREAAKWWFFLRYLQPTMEMARTLSDDLRYSGALDGPLSPSDDLDGLRTIWGSPLEKFLSDSDVDDNSQGEFRPMSKKERRRTFPAGKIYHLLPARLVFGRCQEDLLLNDGKVLPSTRTCLNNRLAWWPQRLKWQSPIWTVCLPMKADAALNNQQILHCGTSHCGQAWLGWDKAFGLIKVHSEKCFGNIAQLSHSTSKNETWTPVIWAQCHNFLKHTSSQVWLTWHCYDSGETEAAKRRAQRLRPQPRDIDPHADTDSDKSRLTDESPAMFRERHTPESEGASLHCDSDDMDCFADVFREGVAGHFIPAPGEVSDSFSMSLVQAS